MTGRLIAIVGPSGVGKDSVIEGLCAMRSDLHRVRRVITRAADAGGEDFQAVPVDQFHQMRARGEFTLSWGAHDLNYGIPTSVHDVLARGQDAVVNLSRGVLKEAQEQFDTLEVVVLVASPEVLAARLAARGRETPQDITRRLSRITPELSDRINVVEIRNDRPLPETLQDIGNVYFPESV